ncbi:xyloside xylosyltransferase 1 isoform X2 [Pyxicephalus adspersus]|uniref:xyloside xylosyltransferase 1 isoform X2 n=1 Tax=Pyxicephalus adspersus TaxID=30357 RepID=UPI003B5C1AAF
MIKAQLLGRIITMRSYQAVLLFLAALAVFAFYYLGSGKESFSSTTRRIMENSAGQELIPDLDLAASSSELKIGEGKSKNLENRGVQDYHLLMMFTKVDRSPGLRDKFQLALRSLLKYGKFESHEVLSLHFVSDEPSKDIGKTVLRDLLQGASFKYKVIFHDVSALTEKLFPIVEAMQKLFSAGTGTYYSDSIFFLSVALHHILPKDITRIIQLDLDLKFKTNIRELFEEFDNFFHSSVIGIAHEMQPVYRINLGLHMSSVRVVPIDCVTAMLFAIPMVWREPRDHLIDCYFCRINKSEFSGKTKHKIVYPSLDSAVRACSPMMIHCQFRYPHMMDLVL